MSQRAAWVYLWFAFAFGGCAKPFIADKSLAPSPTTTSAQLFGLNAPLRHSWQRLTQDESKAKLEQWNWVTGIPCDAPRAELLSAEVSQENVARLFPKLQAPEFRLASTQSHFPGLRIINIGGREVHNCADFYDALDKSDETSIQIDLQTADGQEFAVATNAVVLQTLAVSVARQHSVMRVSDHGNPALAIRDTETSGKLVTRVERTRGLLQLVLSLQNIGSQELLLPLEVRATCDGQPLQCLTVSETLGRLYGPPPERADHAITTGNLSSESFAAVSNREDYLIPTNYNHLCNQLVEKNIETGSDSLQPAFAAVCDNTYPGLAILGDARALTGILLQQQIVAPRDREKTGWIVFAGETLRRGGVVEVTMDIGSGTRSYRFTVPAP